MDDPELKADRFTFPSAASIAAIDAGSNAIRLAIVYAVSANEMHRLESERVPVRLGHHVFTTGRFDESTIDKAVEAFRHFAALFARYGVRTYRAVATSATREAENRAVLLARLEAEAGIKLEVVDAMEEAALVQRAAQAALKDAPLPWIILDLGGGSLDITILQKDAAPRSSSLPIGTVRLMETLGVGGAMKRREADRIKDRIQPLLEASMPRVPDLSRGTAVLCGGNAEVLARIVPGSPRHGSRTLDVAALEERLASILAKDIKERMDAFEVRRDRAEVMGVAAVVFSLVAKWLGIAEFSVPGVGVREGILADLVAERFAAAEAASEDDKLIGAVRRHLADVAPEQLAHSENVRDLALRIFDDLQGVHGLDKRARLVLEAGALLHDVGHALGRFQHHRHGEYLVHSGLVPFLAGKFRERVACLVRFHGKTDPDNDHGIYERLSKPEKKEVRTLTGILRVADGLDAARIQEVESVRVTVERDRAVFRLRGKAKPRLAIWGARRKVALLERDIDLKAGFRDETRR